MTLSEVRQGLVDQLCARGIHAIPAWEGLRRKSHPKGVAVVSLHSLELLPLGQQNYLGLRSEADSTAQIPVYGRKVALTFDIELYAPKDGVQLCHQLFEALGEAVCGGLSGLVAETLSCGQVRYDADSGLLVCPCLLACQGWCYLTQGEDGSLITDFIVKGAYK